MLQMFNKTTLTKRKEKREENKIRENVKKCQVVPFVHDSK